MCVLDGSPVSALSGGNRQRLVLARELSGKPDLIVAEEPTRGLDIRGADLARRRLRKAAKAGAGVLVISYDLVLVLASGRLLEPATQPPTRDQLAKLMAS